MNTGKQTIVYVTREIERALGIPPGPNYRIVANRTEYGELISKQYPEYVTLLDIPAEHTPGHLPSTADLIAHPSVVKLMKNLEAHKPVLLVFKNSLRIEAAAAANKWHILNPSTALAEKVENKITQVSWLGDIGTKYLPPHKIQSTKTITFDKDPFVLQWAHSHTGGGTQVISKAADLAKIQEKFPDRLARITDFIVGPSFTVNAVVAGRETLIGNISYQITGLTPFTENPFSTIGNDWGLTHSLLSETEIEEIHSITRAVGSKLANDGWKGLFGVDVIRDDSHGGRIHLIEVNARQPASTTYESLLQAEFRSHSIDGLLTFEAHIEALTGEALNIKIGDKLIEINDGAQVLQRVTQTIQKISPTTIANLKESGYKLVSYENTEPNADLLRIQSSQGIMETHDKWNSRGNQIIATLES